MSDHADAPDDATAAPQTGAPARDRPLTAEEARAVWHGLLDGLWRIVKRVDEVGRRSVVLRRAAPGEEMALDPRERRAIALAAAGESNKAIGFALEVAPSTAAGILGSACRKLGLGSRRELIELFGAARGE
jgi:DNA-binding CsgD family transcriptional regulator